MTPAVISLCDLTGNAVKPWAEAGYDCFCVDIQHSIRRDRVVQVGAGRIEWAGVDYVQENSIGLLSSIPHIGKPTHYFHPWQYAGWCEDDNYTKNTALWASDGFVMPEPRPAPWLGEPDDRIHKATPGDDRANFRSASPVGFWTAVFHANRPDRPQISQAAE